MKYHDRHHAGKVLAKLLMQYKKSPDAIILALPRGGVPVAYEIAKQLLLPLEVFIVRKLGVPGHEEFAMGAIASGEVVTLNESVIDALKIQKTALKKVLQAEKKELIRREKVYLEDRLFPSLTHKTIILVDDGIATGLSMRAAIIALKAQNPQQIIVAIPVGSPSTCKEINQLVQDVVCPLQPHNFAAVGLWYDNFSQTTDEEVIDLLKAEHSSDDELFYPFR